MCVPIAHAYRKFSEYTHTQVTNAMSTVYPTLDYEYRLKNKGTNLDLVPKKGGVYKRDQESYKMCTVPINIYELSTHKMLILTHTEVTNAMPTVYTTLDYDYRHKKKSIDQVWYSRDVVCGIES